jgi:inhibitor of KinA
LELLSQSKKISKQKIIKLHSSTIYDVHFIGFLPGFLYLGGLKEELHFERKSTPRQKINKGDIAIAKNQTGIYPRVSPGGWNIIGNSPINFFNVNLDPPCFARSGDRIKFISVDKNTYKVIEEKVKQGVYIIENEQYE